jgi:hypothetical protein
VGCKVWLRSESLETNTDRWLTNCGARSPTQKSAAWIAASYQSNDEQYQDRPNSSGDDLIDDPGPNMDSQVREYPTSDKRAHDSNGDVTDETEAPAGYDFPSQPTCNEANQQYDYQTFA